jgi:hypothetical protein
MFSNKLHLYLQIKFSRRDFSNYKIKLNISVKVLSVNTTTESTKSDKKYNFRLFVKNKKNNISILIFFANCKNVKKN